MHWFILFLMPQASAGAAIVHMLLNKSSLGPGKDQGTLTGNIYTGVLLEFSTYP